MDDLGVPLWLRKPSSNYQPKSSHVFEQRRSCGVKSHFDPVEVGDFYRRPCPEQLKHLQNDQGPRPISPGDATIFLGLPGSYDDDLDHNFFTVSDDGRYNIHSEISWLVVWNMNFIFHNICDVILPIDFHIFPGWLLHHQPGMVKRYGDLTPNHFKRNKLGPEGLCTHQDMGILRNSQEPGLAMEIHTEQAMVFQQIHRWHGGWNHQIGVSLSVYSWAWGNFHPGCCRSLWNTRPGND